MFALCKHIPVFPPPSVAHLIITLDGVVKFDVVADMIVKLRDTEEVIAENKSKAA